MAKRNDDDITQEYIRAATIYNEEDGMLYWRTDRPKEHFSSKRLHTCHMNRFAGKVCGHWMPRTDSKREGFGYYTMRLNCKSIKTHRMIFLYHHGYLPHIVDHIDTDTRNCRIGNLRDATIKRNAYNQNKPNHNTTGFKGVARSSTKNYKYKAGIMKKGKTYNIGYYNNLEEAAAAYNIVAKFLFGSFCKLNDTPYPESDVEKTSKFWTVHYPRLLEENNE